MLTVTARESGRDTRPSFVELHAMAAGKQVAQAMGPSQVVSAPIPRSAPWVLMLFVDLFAADWHRHVWTTYLLRAAAYGFGWKAIRSGEAT